MAGGEYALDLAVAAARRALALSRYGAGTSTRSSAPASPSTTAPDEFTLEPATAALVRKALGARNALVFDVVNACAGMLNGIWVLQGLIRSGAIRRGMVVSGEQNMPLAETATREVRHSLDRQLAALTLGDAGAALILDGSPDDRAGFHRLDLVTGAKHDHYCHSQPVAARPRRHPDHQGARPAAQGQRALPRLPQAGPRRHRLDVRRPPPRHPAPGLGARDRQGHPGGRAPPGLRHAADVFRSIAEHYGNTTTTSHFVALHDLILRGEVASRAQRPARQRRLGDRHLPRHLTLDDLPERYRAAVRGGAAVRRCRIESLGVSLPRRSWRPFRKGSVGHAVAAGQRCLRNTRHRPADVGVLVNAGVHRDGHVCEPAIAAYIQHRLGINVEFQGRPTLSFDLLNGGCGMLNAAHVVAAQMAAGLVGVGMVVASEANSDRRPDPGYPYPASGAALLLDLSPRRDAGFGAFAFETREEDADLYTSVVSLARSGDGSSCAGRRARGGVASAAGRAVERSPGAGRASAGTRSTWSSRPRSRPASWRGCPGRSACRATRWPTSPPSLPDTLSTSIFLALHRLLSTAPPAPGTWSSCWPSARA